MGDKQIKREIRKKRRKTICKILHTLLLIAFGYLIALHKDVIKQAIKDGKMPKVPKDHCFCPCISLYRLFKQ